MGREELIDTHIALGTAVFDIVLVLYHYFCFFRILIWSVLLFAISSVPWVPVWAGALCVVSSSVRLGCRVRDCPPFCRFASARAHR